MRAGIVAVILVTLTHPTQFILAAEEAAGTSGEPVVGVSNLILMMGIVAVVVVGVALGASNNN